MQHFEEKQINKELTVMYTVKIYYKSNDNNVMNYFNHLMLIIITYKILFIHTSR